MCVNTYFDSSVNSKSLSFEFFANHAEEKLIKGEYIEGYRPGVCIIKLDKKYVEEVYCPYVKINGKTKLTANYIKRRNREEAYIQIRALNGVPLKAREVGLILYSHDVLKENKFTVCAIFTPNTLTILPEDYKPESGDYIAIKNMDDFLKRSKYRVDEK